MKRFSFIIALPLLMLAAGCAEEPAESGKGSVALDCSVAGSVGVVTRAETRELPATAMPAVDDLKLVVSNAGGVVSTYNRFADYDAPLLWTGDYTFVFSYGTPDAEGPSAAYYYSSQPVTIVARKEITQTVSVPLANAAYSFAVSEWFEGYYSQYSLTVTTESGLAKTYAGSDSEPLAESDPIFVKAGTKLYLKGTATKTNGVEVAFQNTMIGTTAACTWHTVTADVSTIGHGAITIKLDDTPTEIHETDIELNPDAE